MSEQSPATSGPSCVASAGRAPRGGWQGPVLRQEASVGTRVHPSVHHVWGPWLRLTPLGRGAGTVCARPSCVQLAAPGSRWHFPVYQQRPASCSKGPSWTPRPDGGLCPASDGRTSTIHNRNRWSQARAWALGRDMDPSERGGA